MIPEYPAEHYGLHRGAYKLGPKTQELIRVLDELAFVLESDENTYWGGWMRKARAQLLNSDYSGVEYLLSAYGGMGSINDLVLGQGYKAGVFEWKPGHIQLNAKFSALSSKAWELADAIKRSQ
jgi:hypothetical protein